MDVYTTLNVISDINMLPKVLNVLVVEYIFSMYTEKELRVKNVIYDKNVSITVRNDNIYIYNSDTKELKIEPYCEELICSTLSQYWYAFNGKLTYVYDDKLLYIFDEHCNNVQTIDSTDLGYCVQIEILDNILYMQCMSVMEIFIVSIELQNKGTIKELKFSHNVRQFHISECYLFVLLINNIILKTTTDGKILKEYAFLKHKSIKYFYIFDDELYIIFERSNNVFVYDFCEKYMRTIFVTNPFRILRNNNIFYIISHTDTHTHSLYHINIYSREKLNFLKK